MADEVIRIMVGTDEVSQVMLGTEEVTSLFVSGGDASPSNGE